MIDPHRLVAAYQQARDDLLNARVAGHWVGQLSTSALSTATAVSALALVERDNRSAVRPSPELIDRGLAWLAGHQNDDGGWGDTDKSYSNVATTMLVRAAFHLGGWSEGGEANLSGPNSTCNDKGASRPCGAAMARTRRLPCRS